MVLNPGCQADSREYGWAYCNDSNNPSDENSEALKEQAALMLEIGFPITIQMAWPSKTMTLWVESSYTTTKLKQMIQGKWGIPVDTQRLIYNGKELADGRTLKDFAIPAGATLHVVPGSSEVAPIEAKWCRYQRQDKKCDDTCATPVCRGPWECAMRTNECCEYNCGLSEDPDMQEPFQELE
jgi:ubiquitin